MKIDAPQNAALKAEMRHHRWREWRRERSLAWRDCQRLLCYAAPYGKTWALIVALTLSGTALSLLEPWPMKLLVDHVLGRLPLPQALNSFTAWAGISTRFGLMAWSIVAGLLFFVANSASDAWLTRSWVRVGQQMVYDLAASLFARLQRRSLVFHSRNEIGDSLSRVTGDSWAVYTVVDKLLFTPGRALITLAGLLLVMARLDFALTLLTLCVMPFVIGSSLFLAPPIRAAAQSRREIESRIQIHVQQILSGIPVVKAFAQEEHELRRFREFTHTAVRARQRGSMTEDIHSLGSEFVLVLGSAAILWLGARHVLSGQLSLGTLLVFLAYLKPLQEQIKALVGVHGALQRAGASARRVQEVLSEEPDVPDAPNALVLPSRAISSSTRLTSDEVQTAVQDTVKGHLQFEDVSFGYQPEQPVLHHLSFAVEPGQSVALVGATGAGKSTLISLVPRFFDPISGLIRLDGVDLRDIQLRSLREQVALVLQEPFLFPLTIAQNIAYGRPEASRQEIEAAAQAAHASSFIERLPQGYDTPVGERGATLSGGEKQRLAIARALLKDAPILILDEPTSALDSQTEQQLMQALEQLQQGRTSLIIAHRLSTIRKADLILVLQGGHLVEAGTHTELLQHDGHYARFYRIQNGDKTVVSG